MSLALDLHIGVLLHGDTAPGRLANNFTAKDSGIIVFLSNLKFGYQCNMFNPLPFNPGGFVANSPYQQLSNDWQPLDLSGIMAGNRQVQYDALNTLNFKMRGYNDGGSVETYIVQGSPSNVNPNTGNTLNNVAVEAIW
jgi:hypothetical protein